MLIEPQQYNTTEKDVSRFQCCGGYTGCDLSIDVISEPNCTRETIIRGEGFTDGSLYCENISISTPCAGTYSISCDVSCVSLSYYSYDYATLNVQGKSTKLWQPCRLAILIYSLLHTGLLSASTNLHVLVGNCTSSAVSLTWMAPPTLDLTDTDPDIDNYTVYITNLNTNQNWLVTVGETEYNFANTSRSHDYQFSVSAWNAVGEGERSETINFKGM